MNLQWACKNMQFMLLFPQKKKLRDPEFASYKLWIWNQKIGGINPTMQVTSSLITDK